MRRINKIIILLLVTYFLSNNSLINYSLSSSTKVIETNLDKILPENLNVGDILFCDVKPKIVDKLSKIGLDMFVSISGYSNDHCAMYIGNNLFIESAPYRFNPIKFSITGVVISPFWKLKTWATNFTYAYVNTSQEIRDDAIGWAKKQLGTPYSGSEGMHCSELVWYAYLKQNLKLVVDYGDYSYNASGIYSLKNADQVIWYENTPAIADAGGPYNGFMDYSINFDGSASYDSDGSIMIYNWSFGDGTYRYGEYVSHLFKKPGIYDVKLEIKDSGGSISYSTVKVYIEKQNKPPNNPKIIGNRSGYVNQNYTFSIYSNDPDEDKIKYYIDWGDGSVESSDFLLNGQKFNISHNWKTSNAYSIKIYASDGELNSSTSNYIMYINEKVDGGSPFYIQSLFFDFIIVGFVLIYHKKFRK